RSSASPCPPLLPSTTLFRSLTTCLGLVPEVCVTHLKPFHTATASAALDHATRSRAGLAVDISNAPDEADLLGRLDPAPAVAAWRSEEHTSELQSRFDLVCRL